MDIRSTVLSEIEAFIAEAQIAETTFGLRAVNDGKFVARLRQGDNVGIATIERVRAFMARHPKPRRNRRVA